MVKNDITDTLQGVLTPVEITMLQRLPHKLSRDITVAVLYGADLGAIIGKKTVTETVDASKGARQALFMCAAFDQTSRKHIGFQAVVQACLDNEGFPDDLP